ncbi:MAG: HAMP domain-containing protein [Candidatus Scalindua rubra]|uniref:histidine kinase n=1 Tax=Candidatus Scalindua brodae TaxID=237368 RepID=A0A0B0EM45_9BACT|nr:MAG: two-component sensor kinase [Candidatus Scalindua brodae]MBZ0109892.1 HAMP domain-containing protein [Candidatus Scalindua rubra]
MNIQRRILLWFIIPFILMSPIAPAVYYFHARKTLKQNVLDQLEIAAEAVEINLHTFIEAKRGMIIDFSSDGFIGDATEEITMKDRRLEYYTSALNNHLITNKKTLDQSIHEVFIVDFKDKVIASTDEGRIGEFVSPERFLAEKMVSGVFVGEPYYDTRLKAFLIDFSTILLNTSSREPIGFIVNRIKIEQREDSVRDGKPTIQDIKNNYSELVAANKIRIIDFGSDGFIRDYAESIARKDERAFYYTDILNNHLYENKQSIDTDLLAVFVVNLDGVIISSTETGQIGRSVSDEPFFTKTMERGSSISDLYHLPDSRQKTFFTVAKLFSNKTDDIAIGIIVNRYSGEFFERITDAKQSKMVMKVKPRKELGEKGETYIVNSDKLMLTGSEFIEDAVFKQVVDTDGVRTAFESGRGMIGIYPDYRGVPVIGYSRYHEELNWVILAEKDVLEAYAPLAYLRNVSVIAGIMCIMVFCAVAVFISRGITLPIKKLIKSTRNMAKGDMTEQITVKSKDEIGILARSFNTMRIKIAKLLKDIEEAKQDWESTFDSVEEIIILYDRGCRITRCNNELLNRLNVRSEDIIGKRCYDLFYDNKKKESAHKHDCEVAKTFKTLKPSTIEKESTILNGTFLLTTFPRYNHNGEFAGVVQIMRDITEQKLAQDQLMLTHKMASLGQLTAGVVHEVLNPVNIISGHVQLLLAEAAKGSKTEEDLKSIQEEIDRIVKITDGLLRFSRKGISVTGDVEMNSLLERIISVVEPEMKLSNIECISRFEVGLPKITANSDELRQVFLNMIMNAKGAMPQGGALTVITESIKEEEVPFVRIWIADTGCGIARKILDKLFDPFFTTKKEGQGTGLGLSISYGIVQNHGGKISVESLEGKGTTFIIDLPVKD